jgi:hypothetical protein
MLTSNDKQVTAPSILREVKIYKNNTGKCIPQI